MKVELKISKASKVVTMANCAKTSQPSCGIMYRSY